MSILKPNEAEFVGEVDVVVIGGGGCGLCAALAARGAGADVVVLEKDRVALGSTAMSTGLIPGAGTKFQAEKGISDTADLFVADILKKTRGETDAELARHLAEESARTIEWLVADHGIPLTLVDSFEFPGHSVHRLHGTAHRSGAELMDALHNAVASSGVDTMTEAPVVSLFADDERVIMGVRIQRPDGSREDIGCRALVLACSGFGGNNDLLAEYIPEVREALYFGHPGNKGDAVVWGLALGAAVADMAAYQGHGSVAGNYGVSIMWAHIMLGGIQVNAHGLRFSNEAQGYSEQAALVLAQPGAYAWSIYDQGIHDRLTEYQDYRDALDTGCVRSAGDLHELRQRTGLPEAIVSTLQDVETLTQGEGTDRWGRDFSHNRPLRAPYKVVKVRGALFQTQGGLCVANDGRVKRQDGKLFPNLFAGGGAARGISGPGSSGYLSGNGLLTATTLGRLAGSAATNTGGPRR